MRCSQIRFFCIHCSRRFIFKDLNWTNCTETYKYHVKKCEKKEVLDYKRYYVASDEELEVSFSNTLKVGGIPQGSTTEDESSPHPFTSSDDFVASTATRTAPELSKSVSEPESRIQSENDPQPEPGPESNPREVRQEIEPNSRNFH